MPQVMGVPIPGRPSATWSERNLGGTPTLSSLGRSRPLALSNLGGPLG